MSKRNMEIMQELLANRNLRMADVANKSNIAKSSVWKVTNTDEKISEYVADSLNKYFELTDPNYMFIADGKTTAQYKTKDIYLYAVGDDVEDSRGNVGVVIDILKPDTNNTEYRYRIRMYNATSPKTCLTYRESQLKSVELSQTNEEIEAAIDYINNTNKSSNDSEKTIVSEVTTSKDENNLKKVEIAEKFTKEDVKEILFYLIDRLVG